MTHGFHRQLQPFQLEYGPPCTHSSSGAGPGASAGRTSQPRIIAPSGAAAVISVTRPGSDSESPGALSRVTSPVEASMRTGPGGASIPDRRAYTVLPSGETARSV